MVEKFSDFLLEDGGMLSNICAIFGLLLIHFKQDVPP